MVEKLWVFNREYSLGEVMRDEGCNLRFPDTTLYTLRPKFAVHHLHKVWLGDRKYRD